MIGSESDLTANEEICDAPRVFLADIDGIQARGKEGIWSAPIGLPPVLSFFQPLLQFFIVPLLVLAVSKLPPYSSALLVWGVAKPLSQVDKMCYERWSVGW